jgi:hypothetical protein
VHVLLGAHCSLREALPAILPDLWLVLMAPSSLDLSIPGFLGLSTVSTTADQWKTSG